MNLNGDAMAMLAIKLFETGEDLILGASSQKQDFPRCLHERLFYEYKDCLMPETLLSYGWGFPFTMCFEKWERRRLGGRRRDGEVVVGTRAGA